jgi:hypothetical protein
MTGAVMLNHFMLRQTQLTRMQRCNRSLSWFALDRTYELPLPPNAVPPPPNAVPPSTQFALRFRDPDVAHMFNLVFDYFKAGIPA